MDTEHDEVDLALMRALGCALPAPRAELVQPGTPPNGRMDIIGIESICSMVAEGSMGPALARRIEVPYITFEKWLDDNDHRAAYDDALILSADSFVAMAEEVISSSADKSGLSRATALATHYKWVAARLNPEKYSEKKSTEGGGAQEVHIHFGIPSRKIIDVK